MPGTEIIDRDMGYADILNSIEKLLAEKHFAKVGFIEEEGSGDLHGDEGNITIAGVAAANEFGAEIRMPPRIQTIYKSINKDGSFRYGGRFVRAKKANFAQDVAVSGYAISIPERSFMRSTVDEQRSQIAAAGEVATRQIIGGKRTTEQALGRWGLDLERRIRRKIQSNVPPPNAPSTIRRKKSAHTLVDTGQMVQSVHSAVASED